MDKTVKFKVEFESNGQKVFRDVTVDVNELQDVIRNLKKEADDLGDSFTKVGQIAMGFDALNSIIGNMSGMVEQLGANYASFDKGMRAVNTMAGLNATELSALTGQVAELSKTVPIARDELANGLYQVISNGVPQDNWIEFLEQSSRAAVGGIADLGQTVTVTSTILKNYGLAWSEAGNIQDKIQTTAKLGVTSFEQLAAALPRVTGTAATLGVSIDDLMATFATLTGVTGNTAEVSTQLAAVFTALVKPSSEATTMAQQMGIQFDAAAVKAAGGFRNFLTQIDADIKSYASAHGMLDQEIYGKLFGSAESLRALIALNGELSDKFGQNIDAMADSAGTIDAAFEQNAGSADAMNQKLENMMATWTDWAGSVAAAIAPYVKWAATTVTAINGCLTLTKTIRTLVAAYRAKQAADIASAASSKAVAAAEGAEAVAAGAATVATKKLTIALIGMGAAATFGLSAIISLVAMGLAKLIQTEDGAILETDNLIDANEAFKDSAARARSAMEQEIGKLKNLIDTKADATEAVKQLNAQYGDIFGTYNTAAEWYDTLIKKSKDYCDQLAYEAQYKAIADKKGKLLNQLAEAQREKADVINSAKSQERMTFTETNKYTGQKTVMSAPRDLDLKGYTKSRGKEIDILHQIEELDKDFANAMGNYNAAKNRLNSKQTTVKWQDQSYNDLAKTIEQQRTKVGSYAGLTDADSKKQAAQEAATLTQMQERYKALGKKYGLADKTGSNEYDGKKLIKDAQSYKELGNNVKYYQTQLEKVKNIESEEGKAKAAELNAKLNETLKQQNKVKIEMEAAGLPAELKTLDDFNKKLAWLEEVRKVSTDVELPGIDKAIKETQELKAEFEDAAIAQKKLADYSTYDEVTKGIAYYEKRINSTSGTTQKEARKMKKSLEELKQAWDDAAEDMTPPDLNDLSSARKINESIDYLQSKQERSSTAEALALQKQVNQLERAKKTREQILSLPEQRDQLNDLGKMKGKKLTMELELIGLSTIQDNIRNLQKILDNTELSPEVRKETEAQRDQWKKYEKQLKRSQVTMKGAWSSVEGIGGALTSMTSTLKGSGTAWEKVCGAIDGIIQLYDGFSSIIKMIGLFAGTSEKSAIAKTEEAGATAANAIAEGTSAGVAAATLPVVSEEIALYKALAIAKTYAAYAEIPFAGFAIASGFVGIIEGMIDQAAIPKFADGGIAYGPTLGIFGEYAGAANNPEVVAPLDKLKSLIGEGGGGMGGEVTFRIHRRELVGVLQSAERYNKRVK
jgi:TP901 family phage tail tape measure protein